MSEFMRTSRDPKWRRIRAWFWTTGVLFCIAVWVVIVWLAMNFFFG